MRETVLIGITVPPPNAMGRCRQTNALVTGYSYARWRTPATGGPFSMVRIYVRVNSYAGKVIIGEAGDNPIDASQIKTWLDTRRAGEPACSVFRNSLTAANIQQGIVGIYTDIPMGGKMIELPTTLSISNGIFVQSMRSAQSLQVTFFWFEP